MEVKAAEEAVKIRCLSGGSVERADGEEEEEGREELV